MASRPARRRAGDPPLGPEPRDDCDELARDEFGALPAEYYDLEPCGPDSHDEQLGAIPEPMGTASADEDTVSAANTAEELVSASGAVHKGRPRASSNIAMSVFLELVSTLCRFVDWHTEYRIVYRKRRRMIKDASRCDWAEATATAGARGDTPRTDIPISTVLRAVQETCDDLDTDTVSIPLIVALLRRRGWDVNLRRATQMMDCLEKKDYLRRHSTDMVTLFGPKEEEAPSRDGAGCCRISGLSAATPAHVT